ncbi:threonine-phosphate decarboxylase CobD [Brevibacillus panacihumi]|uniref:threonine-phosphate decarboxylase n=1 Tax=Brevibacillus panacihumi TaxID=497735 RepID=A0A3M8DDG3_9BACL|nr:threonine-phosphate decarboxylase CobD [Brevibacillus panacihumi]RNB85619.1 threonine-phosphate decarboxylase [Brevibacillus panacihumi]
MEVLEKYGHGGDWVSAAKRYGMPENGFLDYSANINPLGPPPSVITALQNHLHEMTRYPDPAHRAFRQALGKRLKQDEDWLLPANGAAEAMALALLALAPEKVGVVYPCFSEYAQLSEQFGAQVMGCFGREENGYKAEESQLRQLFEQTDLVFVGSPNNPTGIRYAKAELERMANWTSETDTWLIVDEAFLDFIDEDHPFTLADSLGDYPRVILMRSMTKMYAIPGLRLGYAIAHPDVIARMKAKQVSWSVNALALLAGERCLEEFAYEEKTRKLIAGEREYLRACLHTELGWQVWPGEANFLLVRSSEDWTAQELQAELGKKGILIRSCAMYPGLTPRDFRIAVRKREENEQLIDALREVCEERGTKR